MNSIKDRVKDFLKINKMDFEDISIEKYCSVFLSEMNKGLDGRESSLQMIPTYIEVKDKIPINEKVIVVDAGGTNLRTAIVYFDNDKNPVITNFKKYKIPGSDREVDKHFFFKTIAEYLNEIIEESKNIGFCFSYPAEILSNRDGKPVSLTKELKVKNLEGELLGENINFVLNKSGYKKKNIVVLNDTVATLLAGQSTFKEKVYDSYIGFILGTGTNCSYIEKNKNIKKISGLVDSRSQIINIESGGFNKGPTGVIDEKFDKTTKNPGIYTFEKMVSGKYFGLLCYFVIKDAVTTGLFSEKFVKAIDNINELTTAEVNDFMNFPFNKNNLLGNIILDGNNDDRVTLYYLIDRLIERIAKLTAINLAGVVLKTEKGVNPCLPVCITAEGTTFYRLKSLRSKVEYYMRDYLINYKDKHVEFINLENATLIGAAIAGLTN